MGSAMPGYRPNLPDVSLNNEWDFRSDVDEVWSRVRVPGAYAGVRKGWGGEQWDGFDYPRRWEDKGGTYRRTFRLPEHMRDREVRFYCDACAHHGEVRVNGVKVGEWHDGYTPVEVPITPALKDGDNLLEVDVSARKNDLFDDYGTYRRGMWQGCCLRARPELCVEDDLFIVTSHARREIRCELPVRNLSPSERRFSIACVVKETGGAEVRRFGRRGLRLAAGAREVFTVANPWSDPILWFPHDPHLYELHARVEDEDGSVVDHRVETFGFREIAWKGPHLFINGRELFLRGHGGHYLGDIQGSRAYFETWLGERKKLGINFMRLHDSPKHAQLYEVADELGMLLESEAVCHFKVPEDDAVWKGHLERLVKHHRNHPSVILWSVSNELRWRGGGEKPAMIEWVKRFDTTRPVFASDFSLESRHGDVCGHHYDPGTVFEDWETYGPGKPLVWDELGSVWQHDRPLDNGTSGYEVQAQDYATGLWHDGHDQIDHDLSRTHDGRTIGGELHRINAYCIWDFAYVFFRWQPLNNNRLLELSHAALDGPDVKLKHIRPCASPVNIWDSTLPAMEPNPGFHLFAPYLRPVRFFDDAPQRSFFGQASYRVASRLFYDDTRLCDRLACRVETTDGRLLTETSVALALEPGGIIDKLDSVFEFPETERPLPVRLVRAFAHAGREGYRDERDAKVFPRQVAFPGAVCVWKDDPDLAARLSTRGVRADAAPGTADVIVARGASALDDGALFDLLRQGARAVVLCVDAPDPEHADSAMIPLNGPDHRLMDGLDQADISAWTAREPAAVMPVPDRGNVRVVLAGNRDGDGAALYERFLGSGLAVVTSLNVLSTNEPAAPWMLGNLLNHAADYRAKARGGTMLLGGKNFGAFLAGLGLLYREFAAEGLNACDTLILDAACPESLRRATTAADAIRTFVREGGHVLAVGAAPETIGPLAALCELPLRLTDPFLGERSHCIKAPVSWTRVDTPYRPVEYYAGIMIPQPFEPNFDPLLAGLVNRDLDWDGESMFDSGIELEGMDPVAVTDAYSILISNWRIDWSKPSWGGEYIHAGKDQRRADWFVNRDPVLLRASSGGGSYIFCQLRLSAGGEKGVRVARQLLTNLHCALDEATQFAADDCTFEFAARRDQLCRSARRDCHVKPARRCHYGTPERLGTAGACTVLRKTPLMLAGDALLHCLFPHIQEDLWETHDVLDRLCRSSATSRSLLEGVRGAKGLADIPVFLLTVGLEDLRLDCNGKPRVSIDEFTDNLEAIVSLLEETGAKVHWNTIVPVVPETTGMAMGLETQYNRAAQDIMDAHGVYTFDLNRWVRKSIAQPLCGEPQGWPSATLVAMAGEIAAAIEFFGAQ
jgi:hypothetical protein